MSGMVAKGKIYDVFISYHESDKEWVTEQLLQHLEDENFSVCWDDRDFEPGKTIIENKLNGLCSSSCTVVVLTSKYGADEDLWTTLIEKCCVNVPEIIREFRLLPILLRQCKVPDLFAPLWKLDWTNKVAQKFFWKKLTQAILKNVTDRRDSQSYSECMSTAELARCPATGEIGNSTQSKKRRTAEIENVVSIFSDVTEEVNGTHNDLEHNIQIWKCSHAVENNCDESEAKDNNKHLGRVYTSLVPRSSRMSNGARKIDSLSIVTGSSNEFKYGSSLQPAENLSLEHERKSVEIVAPALEYGDHLRSENSDGTECGDMLGPVVSSECEHGSNTRPDKFHHGEWGSWLRPVVSNDVEHQKVVRSSDSDGVYRSKGNSNGTVILHDPNTSEYDRNMAVIQEYGGVDTQADTCPVIEQDAGGLSDGAENGLLEKIHPRIIGLFVPEDDDLTREDIEELTLKIEDVSLCDDDTAGTVSQHEMICRDTKHVIEKKSREKKSWHLHRFSSQQEQILVLDFLQGQEMWIRKRFENCLDTARKRRYRRLLEKFDKAICSTVNGRKDSNLLASLNVSGLFETEHRGFECSCCDRLFHSERALNLHMADCIERAWRSILAFGTSR